MNSCSQWVPADEDLLKGQARHTSIGYPLPQSNQYKPWVGVSKHLDRSMSTTWRRLR